jgi:hypothetical protein
LGVRLFTGVVRRSSSVFGLVTLFFYDRLVRQDYAMDGDYLYTVCWGMVSNRNLVGEIFHCCPLAAGRRKMYEKSHFIQTVDDFNDFSRSYGEKYKNSKTMISRLDISPNSPHKFFEKISSSF